MSILPDRSDPPNLATAFLVQAAAGLFKDPRFSKEIEVMDQNDATEDEMGGRIAVLSMLRASQTLAQSGAALVVDAVTHAGPESHIRSLEGIFGKDSLPLIFSQPILFSKMPAAVSSSLQLWRFNDGSYIFHSSCDDPSFGEFCRECLENGSLVEALDRKHRAKNGGDPLSQAALAYIKESLERSRTACFPFAAEALEEIFGKQSLDDMAWLPGYSVKDSSSGVDISPGSLKSQARQREFNQEEALARWTKAQEAKLSQP